MTRDEKFALNLFIATHMIQHGRPPTWLEVGAVRGHRVAAEAIRENQNVRVGVNQ